MKSESEQSPWPAAAGVITGATSAQSQSKFACGGTLLVHGLTTSTQKHQRKELEEVSSYVGIHFPVMFPFLTFSDGSKSGHVAGRPTSPVERKGSYQWIIPG
jgi:hypothetical protein